MAPVLVKCLGHCNKTFLSPDKSRVRICDVCKKRNNRMIDKEPTKTIKSNRKTNDPSS